MSQSVALFAPTDGQLSAVFDALPLPLVVTTAETGRVVAANAAFCELVGLAPHAVVGVEPPYPWEAEAEPAGDDRVEALYRGPDGRLLPVELALQAVPAADDSPASVLAVVTDLTEKRRFEQQLVQGGKLAAVGELAAGVAHEVNNPLFAILGLTEFLLKDAEPGSQAAERLELIRQSGEEIKEIVRALLEFARERPDERHVVPLEQVVRQTVTLVRRTNAHKGIELVERYGSRALVRASSNQLKQLFLNLIANARQAMPDGGTVTLTVQRRGHQVAATVSDEGPGVPSEIAGRIFDPFFGTRTLAGGVGLGLSASLGIAQSHGGTLLLDEGESGASFTLLLPVVEEEQAP